MGATLVCAAGTLECNKIPQPDVCDGVDNDCDGTADEPSAQLSAACNASNPTSVRVSDWACPSAQCQVASCWQGWSSPDGLGSNGCESPDYGQACNMAIGLPPTGAMFSGVSIAGFANNDPGNTDANCMFAAAGPEQVYSMSNVMGHPVTVSVVASFDAIIYVRTSCTTSGATAQCVDQRRGLGSEVLTFTPPDNNPFFIYVDSTAATTSGTYDISVTVN